MMTMDTQFGKMTITDDNQTMADKELQNHIKDSMENGKIPTFAQDNKEEK